MKPYLLRLSILSLSLLGSFSFADTPPEGTLRFRPNNQQGIDGAGVSFSDPATWNEYQDSLGAWVAISMDVLPWELPWVSASNPLNLKMDNSIVNVDSAVGSADSFANFSISNLFRSTINISKDFYITGSITQDGESNLNVSSGANVSLNNIGQLSSVNISGAGTNFTIRENNYIGNNFTVSDGAAVNMVSEKNFIVSGAESGVTFENATLNGNLQILGGVLNFKNSTLNAGVNNNPVQAKGTGSAVFENSVINSYYTGWDSTSTAAAGWKGNTFFLGLGKGTQQTFTLKNTVVSGGGAADGTSYWDMDPETRKLSDIAAGGNLNLGWDAFENGDEYFIFNMEDGTRYAGRGIEFGNAAGAGSTFGTITINQGGTDLDEGYTMVHLNGDINMRASTYLSNDLSSPVENTFSSNYNLLGYTELLTDRNLNLGSGNSRGGSANFTISGDSNTVSVHDFYLNSGTDSRTNAAGEQVLSDATVNFIFGADSSNSTFTATANVNNNYGAMGTHNMTIDGVNNTFKSNTLNFSNSKLTDGKTGNFKMLGEGNTLDLTRFLVSDGGTQDAATGGNVNVYFAGSNAANKNHVFMRNGVRTELLLQGSTTAGSKLAINWEFAGNTVFRSNDLNSGVWVKIHEWAGKDYTTNSTMLVSGTGNDLLFSGLEIGNGVTTSGGKGTFKVASTGGRIEINAKNTDGFNGLRVNASGVLSYAIQDGGIDTIYNYTKNNTTFRGKLEIDFNEMTRQTLDESGLAGGWEKFTLFATIDGTLMSTNGFLGTWFEMDDLTTMEDPFGKGYTYLTMNEEYVSVITRDDSDEYMFVIDETFIDDVTGESLMSFAVLYKSTVPEPATYAAIFGALALAFAAYRKRR